MGWDESFFGFKFPGFPSFGSGSSLTQSNGNMVQTVGPHGISQSLGNAQWNQPGAAVPTHVYTAPGSNPGSNFNTNFSGNNNNNYSGNHSYLFRNAAGHYVNGWVELRDNVVVRDGEARERDEGQIPKGWTAIWDGHGRQVYYKS